ncbi:MAG: hypothetical protein Ta2B_05150 [Termitinemataceae bacterium]|nr:MAG: hypothetical protein Ta2B_05150 [Termitinemataceae bacterium]
MFNKRVTLISIFILLLCMSCTTSGMYYKSSDSWSRLNSNIQIKKIKLGTIKADKSGGSLTIEREISQLLPLLFLEQNFVFTNNSLEADYIVDVHATEREYFVGWETKKSVTMEVLFWANDHLTKDMQQDDGNTQADIETPLIAGRIVAQGSQGLASSNNLQDILRRSIGKVIAAVPVVEVETDSKLAEASK